MEVKTLSVFLMLLLVLGSFIGLIAAYPYALLIGAVVLGFAGILGLLWILAEEITND